MLWYDYYTIFSRDANMPIQNESVRLLLDEVRKAYLAIPNFAHFVKGDYAIAARFPDKSREALAECGRMRTEHRRRIEAVRATATMLTPYDSLSLGLAAYFVDWMMFPVSPLLEPYYDLIFGITPYELLVEPFWDYLKQFPCDTPERVEKHMALTADLVRYARGMRDKLFAQAERGIYLFADVIPSTCDALNTYLAVPYENHALNMRRAGSAATEVQIAVEAARVEQANGYYREMVAFLQSDAYQARAPKTPGWGQFAEGANYYRLLRQFHLGYDLSAQALHALGLTLLREGDEQQAAISARLGYNCDHAEFLARLRGITRFYPQTPADLALLMNSIKEREASVIPAYFNERVRAPYALQRLDPGMEQSLTFGYFQPSYDETQPGVYYYNASGLADKCQITTPGLLAHELVPGHHFHQSYINESSDMHPLIKAIVAPACLEGWAEYASRLMSEVGVFDDYDEYGRLENEKFICARLVVDTGLSELGWSFEQARQFMQTHTFATRPMAESETLRYACSLPAQCLSYKYGSIKLLEIRERYRAMRGDDYDIREFHSLVLNAGCIPLPLLQSYIEREALRGGPR